MALGMVVLVAVAMVPIPVGVVILLRPNPPDEGYESLGHLCMLWWIICVILNLIDPFQLQTHMITLRTAWTMVY
eukprot:scaffold3801_cov75-Attheya_sp.AAC.1